MSSTQKGLAAVVALLATSTLLLIPAVGSIIVLGVVLGIAWRRQSVMLPIGAIVAAPLIAVVVVAWLSSLEMPLQEHMVLRSGAFIVLVVSAVAYSLARRARWTRARSAVCAAAAPAFGAFSAALLWSLPDSGALRDGFVHRFEVPWQLVAAERFRYEGDLQFDNCLGSHHRRDDLTLAYDIAADLEEGRYERSGPGLEEIVTAQLPGQVRVVSDPKEDVRISRTRRETDVVPYRAARMLRWPLPAVTRWVGSVPVPTIRRSEWLLLPSEGAVLDLRAPAGCIATTFPPPTSVERGREYDRFAVPVGRRASFGLHSTAHVGQDPYAISLLAIVPPSVRSGWVPRTIDWFEQSPVKWVTPLLAIAAGLTLASHPRQANGPATAGRWP